MTDPERSTALSKAGTVTASVVSHGHGAMLVGLLKQLMDMPEIAKIIITLNIAESVALPVDARITVLYNAQPLGFGANHNRAFAHCSTPYFCVLNPDISLPRNPFNNLLQCVQSTSAQLKVGVIAPAVCSPQGALEDSVRSFPTVLSIVKKAFGVAAPEYSVQRNSKLFCPDWVAGMFMLFPVESYASVGGFDARYFLYYEDVDICVRMWRKRLAVMACMEVSVIHDARRASHRNLRHLRWHVTSISRYFLRYAGRLPVSTDISKAGAANADSLS